MNVIVTNPPRVAAESLAALRSFGTATVHEAMGRAGNLNPDLRPIQQGLTLAGSAVTVLSWPGDNLMVHAAVELCRPGDILVVATTAPSTHGMFGELFATALLHRGVRGVVIDAGVRDTAELRAMGFGAWSRWVSIGGTVKATAGSVNLPVVIGGQQIHPGDAVVADDDGVVVVPRARIATTIREAQARIDKESLAREAFRTGELSLDRYGLRDLLSCLDISYRDWSEFHTAGGVE